jgi:hypothetical protein
VSSLIVVPEKRFAYAAFGNSTTAAALHEHMNEFVLTQVAGLPAPERIEPTTAPIDPARYVGVYEKQYTRTTIIDCGSGELEVAVTLEYPDAGQRALMREYTGAEQPPPFRAKAVTDSLLVPVDTETDSLTAAQARNAGLTFLDPDDDGRFRYVYSGLRLSRRVS